MKLFLALLLLIPNLAYAGPPVIWSSTCTSGIFNLAKNTCLVSGGSAPSGTANTLGFFNASGNLNSDPNFVLNDTKGWIILSTIGAGASTGQVGIGSSNGIGLVMGNATGTSSIVSTNFGVGNFAFGDSLSAGQISAQGNGSMAGGYTTNAGIVATELNGSISIGVADTSGQVSANGTGNQSFGYADLGGILGSVGSGSMAQGYATNNSIIATTTAFHGQFAGGYSLNTGSITAANSGALAYGYADSSGAVSAAGPGSLAIGRASAGVNLSATGAGAVALGNATVAGITASGPGSFSGGAPSASTNIASGTGAFSWGDGNTGSGNLSTTFGQVNVNPSYLSLVGGRFAQLTGATTSSWVTTDPLFVLGNGVFGTPSNAFYVLKNGDTYAGAGTVSLPGLSFTTQTNSGMYIIDSTDIGFSINGVLAMSLGSASGFGNMGFGTPASSAPGYMALFQRTQSSAGTYIQISNPTTSANAKASIQLSTDVGNTGEISQYTTGSTVPPYIASLVLHATGDTLHTTIISGDNAGADTRIWTNGDFTSAGETAAFNGDHSTTLFGLLQLPVQGSGVTPTCGTGQNGSLALTNGYVLCVCNGSGWVHASTGLVACTF